MSKYTGVDCATKLTAKTASAIKAAGYSFVGRYLVPNAGSLAWKALTKGEAEAISAAGLRILAVWETTADRVKGGRDAGLADGARAAAVAREVGMPSHAAIYFAVDYEATAAQMPVIAAYLAAAKEQAAPHPVGVYGSFAVVEAMAAAGVCEGFWQCAAWSYGKISAHAQVYQRRNGVSVAGVAVDINDCDDMDAAGLWFCGQDASAAAAAGGGIPQFEAAYIDGGAGVPGEARYNTVAEVPDWGRDVVARLAEQGILRGRDDSLTALDLSEDMLRVLVVLERAGCFGG